MEKLQVMPKIDINNGPPTVCPEISENLRIIENQTDSKKIGNGTILVNNLTFESLILDPIYAKDHEEAKYIVELFNFKIKEREHKGHFFTEYSKGHYNSSPDRSSEIAQISHFVCSFQTQAQ